MELHASFGQLPSTPKQLVFYSKNQLAGNE